MRVNTVFPAAWKTMLLNWWSVGIELKIGDCGRPPHNRT